MLLQRKIQPNRSTHNDARTHFNTSSYDVLVSQIQTLEMLKQILHVSFQKTKVLPM